MTQAGSIFVKWQANTADFMRDMKSAREELQSSMKGTVALGKSMRKAGAVMTAAGGAIVGSAGMIVKSWAEAGDEIHKAGLRTGFSADALSRWRVVAQRSGTDLKAVETGVKRMQRSIVQLGDGLAESTRSFDRLGLSLEDIQNLAPEEQMRTIMERMADIEDPTIRAATAQEIFGRAGTQLLPVLEDGAEGLAELMKVADETGETFTEEGAKSAAEYQDAIRDMRGAVQGLVRTLAVELVPIFRQIVDWVKDKIIIMREWMGENKALVGTISRVVLVLGALLAAVGPPMMLFGQFLIMTPHIVAGVKAIGLAIGHMNPILAASTIAVMALVAAYNKLSAEVDEAHAKQDMALKKQADVYNSMREGGRIWRKYGEESVEALKKQELGLRDAESAIAHFLQQEMNATRAGNQAMAQQWRERAKLYREYTETYRDELAELHVDELEAEREHQENLREDYQEHIDGLNEIDEFRLESYEDHTEKLIDAINKKKEADEDAAEAQSGIWEDLESQHKAHVNGMLNSMGSLVEGNKKAAVSGAISTIFNLLPWPFSKAAAAIAKPLIMNMIPSFADGGIVSGPTMGLMGEYPGVKSNPEVIAPLDKLQSMIGGGGGVTVNVNVEELSPESVDKTLHRITEGIKNRVPAAVDFVKRNGDLYREEGGRA